MNQILRLLQLLVGVGLLAPANSSVFLDRDTPAEVLDVVNLTARTYGTEDAMLLLNLNTEARPVWNGEEVDATSIFSQFYILSQPTRGKLYHAYRMSGCQETYPQSCQTCCTSFSRDSNGQNPTCCAKANDLGARLFGVGDEINVFPAMMTIRESSFLWYQPPKREISTNNETFATFTFEVEYWKTSLPLNLPPTQQDSGCAATRANCELAKQGDIWVINNTLNVEILCEGGRRPCAEFCGQCSARFGPMTAEVVIEARRHWPVVGFGGFMIAFDGGDDFLLANFEKLPTYEFSIQFWIQQHKIRPEQTILTWWTDERGREFEIADTTNIYFYHLNNRTARTGVSIDDGKWHHLSFGWRLVCNEEVRIPGATYCVENLFTRDCVIDRDCLYVEILIIVDAEERARAYLPPFLPSASGQMIWGQRMVKPLKTDEVKAKEAFIDETLFDRFNTTANIVDPYTDNQLQLMFNRLRSGYFTDEDLLTGSMSKQAERGTFTEDEPWRAPTIKYCELQGGGGFDPRNALSANLDEVRLYAYFRNAWDVALDMGRVINADSLYTFSNPEANQSLLLYYTFDLYGSDLALFARDNLRNIPLTVRDESPFDGTQFRSEGSLGGGRFAWAPMQVPSTAPLRGSRTVQVVVPDSTESIPIDLIDLVIDDDSPASDLHSRIEEEPELGGLYGGADDCDTVQTADPFQFEVVSQEPACRGSIIGIRVLGGLGTFTSNCRPGMLITASDGYGSGALGNITSVGTGGVITAIEMVSFGTGYDWTLANPTTTAVDSAVCLCGGNPGNVAGNMDPCLQLLIHPGAADTSGAQFSGFSYPLTGPPFATRVTCSNGVCPATKPRPCLGACYRSEGWRSDFRAQTATFIKAMVGPWVRYEEDGFANTYWSNRRHTVWYVPEHLREADFYVEDEASGAFVLVDTIKDQFVVRFFDHFPTNPFLIPDVPHPFVHLWVQVVWEKLALALNSSVAWEESSAVLVHLQLLDFDRGTSALNAPFSVYVDRPTVGQLYQAVRISRADPDFERDCVCPATPRFPDLDRSPETSYYPPGTKLPGARPCRVEDLGQFCMKMGDPISADDTLVTSYYDTRVLPGFQHARDGFFVIYSMGVAQSGVTHFNWRLKHPQGQIQDAKVDIEIRAINNRPVALNTSATTAEDQRVEIRLNGSDPDDPEQPTLLVTEFPAHGQLYQCEAASPSDACAIGEKMSDMNETLLQFGVLSVDYSGALDDETTPVYRAVVSKNSRELRIVQNSPNTSTVLTRGYGFSSYNFDPDEPDNFRKLCGGRGTVAVDITVQHPIFYTEFEVFYPIRYDTPFRLLAKRVRTFPIITYDYNVDAASGVLEDLLTSRTTVHQQGIELTRDDNQRMFYNNDGEFRAERTFSSERIFCQSGGVDHRELVRCQQRWDAANKVVKGEQRAVVEESEIRWFEMYRGLPHQARAAQGRISPVLTDARILAKEFRLEACGEDGRVFGTESPNFMELLNDVRVTGTFSRRPRGFVSDASYRVVYVPLHNFVGPDAFSYVAVDSAGGAKRSAAMFSLQRHRSPPARVDIEVHASQDVPQGTEVVFSSVAAGDKSWEIDLRGTHPGQDGTAPVSDFQIEVTRWPSLGELFLPNSTSTLSVNALAPFQGTVRYGASAGQCGVQYSSFQYRLKNTSEGDDVFSPVHTVTIQLRCRIGFWCNEADSVCEPCPVGTFGVESKWSPNSCVSCPAGLFQDALAATRCEACAPGTHNPRPRSSRCYLCPEGTKNTELGQAHCLACPGGTYYPFKGSVACIKCGPTQYTESEGQYRCKQCPLNTRSTSETATSISFCTCTAGFYDVLGRSGRACLACPHGAYCHGRHLLPVARTGYWTGQELWTSDSWDNATEAEVPGRAQFVPCAFRYIRGVCLGYPDVDVQEQEERCLYKDHQVLLGPSRLGIYTSEGKNVRTVPCTLQPPDVDIPGLRSWIAKQNYSTNSYCAEGYAGRICSECADDYFRSLSGFCQDCSVVYGVPFISLLFWGAIVGLNLVFWLGMFLAAAHRARSLYIFITHAQLAAVLGKLSVPWPNIAQEPLNRFALFNLDLDGMEWNCMGMRWSYSARWFVQLLIPAVIVGATYLFFVYQVSYAKAAVLAFGLQRERELRQRQPRSRPRRGSLVMPGAVPRERSALAVEPERASVTTRSTEELLTDGDRSDAESEPESVHSDRSAATAASGATGSAVSTREGRADAESERKDRDVLVTLSQKDIRKMRDWGYWLTAMNVNLLFVMAAGGILIPWSCTTAAPTWTYLNSHPGTECYTQRHFNMKVVSGFFAVVWCLAFPVAMVYILHKAWVNELVMDRKFKRQFGWLFEHYNPKYAWWEVTVVVRKVMVVSIASLLSDNGYLQVMVLSVFLTLHLVFTFYAMPYVHRRHNVIDLFLQGGYLLLVCYALTNLVGNHGLKIVNTAHGPENMNERVGILQPEPGMHEIANREINTSFVVNVCFLATIGLGLAGTVSMLLYDIYEIKPQAPFWAPYLYNTVFGTPLFTWEQVISQFMALVDRLLAAVREHQRLKPPDRPSSRWAHRVAMSDREPGAADFQSEKTVEEMLYAVVAATQEQEWARDKASVVRYIASLDKRIFAAEMYNGKAPNLPALERERNLAKKRLLVFLHAEGGEVFRALYDQTGRNEQTLWDIQEIERQTTQQRMTAIAQKEHGRQLEAQIKEQERRVGDVRKWQEAYETEKKRCEDLERDVKQARDAVLLYHLESSGSSEDERELDAMLEQRVTDYIENKTAHDLCNEGKMNPMQTF